MKVSEIRCTLLVYNSLTAAPYRGGEVCVPKWPWKLCQRGLQSLVGSTLLGRFQVKGQTNCSTWPSRLGVGRRANNPSLLNNSYYGNRKYFSRIVWDRRRDWPGTSGLWYRVHGLPEPDNIGGWKTLWSPPTDRVTSKAQRFGKHR